MSRLSRLRNHLLAFALAALVLGASPAARADGGTNLSTWNNQAPSPYLFDPARELPTTLGARLTVAAGHGFPGGTYVVFSTYPAFDMGGQGVHNLDTLLLLDSHGAGSGSLLSLSNASGGVWTAGAPPSYTLPSLPPNTAVHGALAVEQIGDSITQQEGALLGVSLATQFPNAQVSVTNDGVYGAVSADCLPGTSTYQTVVQSIHRAAARFASVMYGTNDAAHGVPAAVYVAHMQAIVTGLYADCPTLVSINIFAPPYSSPGALSNYTSDASDALVRSYGPALSALTRAHVSTGLYEFYAANPYLLTDGVHPSDPLGRAALTAYFSVADQPLLAALPAAQPPVPGAPDQFVPASGPFSGVLSNAGAFIQELIRKYGIPAILVGLAVCGWLFVKRIAKTEAR